MLYVPVIAVLLVSPVRSSLHAGSLMDPVSGLVSRELLEQRSDTAAVTGFDTLWTTGELKDILQRQSGLVEREGTKWQRGKNAKVAMLCALIIPGLGQLYNEKPLKSAIAMGIECFYLNQIIMHYRWSKRMEEERDRYDPYISLYNPSTGDTVFVENSRYWKRDWWVNEYEERAKDWIWWSAATLFVIVLDAYIDAHLHDMRFRIEGEVINGGAGVSICFRF